jgi:hypothetical protein
MALLPLEKRACYRCRGPRIGVIEPFRLLVALGYPIGDLVLLFGVAATALRHPPDIDARALTALVAGLGLMFVGDVGYGQLNLTGSFALERWPDVVYLSSTLLIALAGYLQAHPGAATAGQAKTMSRWLLLLPYAGLAAGYAVLIALAQGTDLVLTTAMRVLRTTIGRAPCAAGSRSTARFPLRGSSPRGAT